MPITNLGPDIRRGFESIGEMFAPPSGQELAGYASAKDSNAATALKKQKLSQIAQFFEMAQNPKADHTIFDQTNAVVNGSPLSTGYYGVDQSNATSRANNLVDNQAKVIGDLYGPLNQGQVRPAVPAGVTGKIDLPAIIAAAGAPKPLSETEAKGNLIQQAPPLTPQQLTALAMSDAKTENIVGGDGKAEVVYSPEAVGREPAYAPNATIMSDGLPKPPEGAVWKTGQDGKPVLDERGAPIAIPYQGGPLYQKQLDQETGNRNTELLHDVVLDKIDTALDQIKTNPNLTTGIGAQLSGAVGGAPANDLAQTLNTIKANISFDKLQALRQASPTGGALGNVSDNDMRLLQSTYGSLEQSQSAPQLAQNLAVFKQLYYDTINGPGEYAKKQQADAAAASAGPPLPAGVTEEDVQHTMQVHGLTREQVLARLGGT